MSGMDAYRRIMNEAAPRPFDCDDDEHEHNSRTGECYTCADHAHDMAEDAAMDAHRDARWDV